MLLSIRYALIVGHISLHHFIIWMLQKKSVSCCNSFWKIISLNRDREKKVLKKINWREKKKTPKNKTIQTFPVFLINFPAFSIFTNLFLLRAYFNFRNPLFLHIAQLLQIKKIRFFPLPSPVHRADKAKVYTRAPERD